MSEDRNGEGPGKVVVNGEVQFLSVTGIQKFDPTEPAGCHRAWWFRYIEGRKEPETEALQFGKTIGKELEIYLKTGVDELSPRARAGKYLLPAPGSDLEVEEPLGDIRAAIAARRRNESIDTVRKLAGLTAAGIPLMGAADLRHCRGEYVDVDGTLRRETEQNVIEVLDHKSTARINTHVTEKGNVYAGWAKTPDEVVRATQMVGYGVHAAGRYPGVEQVRLSHIYYQRRYAIVAEKRTGLVPVELLVRRWSRVEQVVRTLIDVAREPDVSKIEPNLAACKAFKKTCHYANVCPRTAQQILAAEFSPPRPKIEKEENTTGMKEDTTMSILTKRATSTTLTSPTGAARTNGANEHAATLTPESPERRAAIVDAKDELRHEIQQESTTPANGAPAKIGDINPPEKPSASENASDPIPPAIAATLPSPARERAEALNAAAAATEQDKSESAGSGGRCSQGAQRVVLSAKQIHERKYICSCGKELSIRPAEVEDHYEATLPGHNRPKPETSVPASVTPASTSAPAPASSAPASVTSPVSTAPAPIVPAEMSVEALTTAMERARTLAAEATAKAQRAETEPPDDDPETAAAVTQALKRKAEKLIAEAAVAEEAVRKVIEKVEAEKIAAEASKKAAIAAANAVAKAMLPSETPADALALPAGQVVTIYLDCAVVGSPQPQPLSTYYDPLIEMLMVESARGGHVAMDVRCAGDGPLAFGKWRGLLAGLVKTRPIPPGEYTASSADDIDTIVVQTLRVRTVLAIRR